MPADPTAVQDVQVTIDAPVAAPAWWVLADTEGNEACVASWARITAIVISVLVLLGALLGIFVQASTILFVVLNVLVAVTALGVIYYLLRPDARGRLAR